MRFEWLALLAINRRVKQADEAWTTLAEVGHLPAWTGKAKTTLQRISAATCSI
jgi:hypothetical protein